MGRFLSFLFLFFIVHTAVFSDDLETLAPGEKRLKDISHCEAMDFATKRLTELSKEFPGATVLKVYPTLSSVVAVFSDAEGRRYVAKWSSKDEVQKYLMNELSMRELLLKQMQGITKARSLQKEFLKIILKLKDGIVIPYAGISLEEEMKAIGRPKVETTLQVRSVLDRMDTLLDLISAFHEANILHLDLKPSNILIYPDGGVVVSDFGIAMREGSKSPEQGTPEFRSTGFIRGDFTEQDDLEQMSKVFFYMLTGNFLSEFSGEGQSAGIQVLGSGRMYSWVQAYGLDHSMFSKLNIPPALVLAQSYPAQSATEWRNILGWLSFKTPHKNLVHDFLLQFLLPDTGVIARRHVEMVWKSRLLSQALLDLYRKSLFRSDLSPAKAKALRNFIAATKELYKFDSPEYASIVRRSSEINTFAMEEYAARHPKFLFKEMVDLLVMSGRSN